MWTEFHCFDVILFADELEKHRVSGHNRRHLAA